jgi:hypothetical protein
VRCYICDVELTEGEISLDKNMQSEPCTTCQQVIYETAYSGKFKNTSYDVADEDDLGDDFEPDDLIFADMIVEEMYEAHE